MKATAVNAYQGSSLKPSTSSVWLHCLETARRRRAGLVPGSPCSSEPAETSSIECLPSDRDLPHLDLPDSELPDSELLDLYAPILSLAPGKAFAIGHLAQGIDGNIATDSGSSRGLSGDENHRHLHRLRALADAVIVGTLTAQLDDPLLTVRLVEGQNPARLVIDPTVRLPLNLRLFKDDSSPSMIVCSRENRERASARWGVHRIIDVDARAGLLDLKQLQARLLERGWPVLLIEGGGVTVSRMLEAGCLDRIQISVSPIMIGGGRRGLQLGSVDGIDDSPRPPARVYQMGEDLLWDMDLRGSKSGASGRADTRFKRIV